MLTISHPPSQAHSGNHAAHHRMRTVTTMQHTPSRAHCSNYTAPPSHAYYTPNQIRFQQGSLHSHRLPRLCLAINVFMSFVLWYHSSRQIIFAFALISSTLEIRIPAVSASSYPWFTSLSTDQVQLLSFGCHHRHLRQLFLSVELIVISITIFRQFHRNC